MPNQRDIPKDTHGSNAVSRRCFIQSAIAISAAGIGYVDTQAVHRAAAAVGATSQRVMLTDVLNTLIPRAVGLPGAGELGLADFVDATLDKAPHLRGHVEEILRELVASRSMALDSDLDSQLRLIEAQYSDSFDVLLQIVYTGYYSHPTVLKALESDSDEIGFRRLDQFDSTVLETVDA